ncbi:FAD-dependent oxidoreductase domain-containing protein 2-like [Amphiura filiformis]|uniref:FAD-dependent oxidoreductase domain-containing protein 2-like n=1 Tax=Amphiura filiformis TaxID=82378 RepID=UPI003B21DE67
MVLVLYANMYSFVFLQLLTLYVLSCSVPGFLAGNDNSKDYCIIGAGPGGLQMGYFLERAKRDYVIFERANTSGAFFIRYPRHRKLISINKRHTGKTNKEFNLRHDWNSLLSDDESLQMRHYSKEFFPPADDYVRYLRDYAKNLELNIQYNTNIGNIQQVETDGNVTHHFTMDDQSGNGYTCRYLIICTGISTPNDPDFLGSEHTDSYDDMSLDTDDYEGQSVLILGRGNSAFETADHIVGSTNLIHMISRSRLRLAWETHYVGDLRAINNGLLDTYMLKSLDGQLEGDVADMMIIKRSDGKLVLGVPYDRDALSELHRDLKNGNISSVNISERFNVDEMTVDTLDFGLPDNFALRDPYDRIIRCLGFKFDFDIFNRKSCNVTAGQGRKKKFPAIKANYESLKVPGLFFAGTNTHSLDFRKSAGGFIHGFRYTARALHNILEWRNHQVPWPSVRQPITELLNHIIKRINEASGTYQMFGVLGDVIILANDDTEYIYLEEYPLKMLHAIPGITGYSANRILVVSLEYGYDFSGPGKDVFRRNRAIGEPSEAHLSNFLHPVIYFYKELPSIEAMRLIAKHPGAVLPEPVKVHHMVEDFLTDFSAPVSHVLVLRRFLESCIEQDLRNFFDNQCFWMALTHSSPPESCKTFFLKGQRLPPYFELQGSLTREQYFGEEETIKREMEAQRHREADPIDELKPDVRNVGFGFEEHSEL